MHQAIITHWHGDHVGGLPDLLQMCPQAQVFKHQPEPEQNEIQESQTFSVDGATLTALHTPGHTVDHMAFILEEENAMFTGDSTLLIYSPNSHTIVKEVSQLQMSWAMARQSSKI